MAVLLKKYRLANPGRKRNYGTREGRSWSGYSTRKSSSKKRKNPGKRLSLKQKLHFGTARQRAAAKLSLKRQKNPSLKKLAGGGFNRKQRKAMVRANKAGEMHGFGKRKQAQYYGQSHIARTNRSKNVGEIVSVLKNPGTKRRKSGMATRRKSRKGKLNAGLRRYMAARKRSKNPGTRRRRPASHFTSYRRRRTRRSNPAVTTRRRRSSRRRRNPVYAMRRINRGRRHNPGMFGVTSGTIGKALGVIGGAIGSKYVTQLALGGNNTSYMGYAGNLAASIGLGWAAGKVTKSKEFGTMVMIGGISALVLRVLNDMTPLGQYVNLSLAGMGKGGDTGLGIIQDSSFPVPQTFAPGSMTQAIVPSATRSFVNSAVSAAGNQKAQMAAAGSKGMGYMQGGRKIRRAIM